MDTNGQDKCTLLLQLTYIYIFHIYIYVYTQIYTGVCQMMAVQELVERCTRIQQKNPTLYLVEKRWEKRMGKSSHPKKYLEMAGGRRNGWRNGFKSELEKRW